MRGSFAASVPENVIDYSGVASQFQNPPAEVKSRLEETRRLHAAAMKSTSTKPSKPKTSKPSGAAPAFAGSDEEEEQEPVRPREKHEVLGQLTLEDEDGTRIKLGVLDHGQNEFCRIFILKIAENFMYMPKAGTKFKISFAVDGEEVAEKLICIGSAVIMERAETMVLTLHRF